METPMDLAVLACFSSERDDLVFERPAPTLSISRCRRWTQTRTVWVRLLTVEQGNCKDWIRLGSWVRQCELIRGVCLCLKMACVYKEMSDWMKTFQSFLNTGQFFHERVLGIWGGNIIISYATSASGITIKHPLTILIEHDIMVHISFVCLGHNWCSHDRILHTRRSSK